MPREKTNQQNVHPPVLLIDTNVWIDLYLPDQPNAPASKELIAWAKAHDVALAFPSSAVLDVYQSTCRWFKKWTRASYGELTEAAAVAIKRMAWDNVAEMQEIATPVPVDASDLRLAAHYRDVHNDLEDDLVSAAAVRAKANYLVTNDKALIAHAPVQALTPKAMLLALKTGNAHGTPWSRMADTNWLYEWLSKEELGLISVK